MDRAEKKQFVAELSDAFEHTPMVFLARNHGLAVPQMQSLRHEMRRHGAIAQVIKNRLAKIAIAGTRYENLSPYLKDPTICVYSRDPEADPIGPSQVLIDFSKSTPKFEIVAVWIGGSVLGPDGVKALAELQSLDELRARLIGLIQAPAVKIAQLLTAAPAGLARAIAAYSELPVEMHPKPKQVAAVPKQELKIAHLTDTHLTDRLVATPTQLNELLPSTIVRRLMSEDVGQRIGGIRRAGELVRSLERNDEMGSAKTLPALEAFEASTLTSRLYDCVFSNNADEAREAAYELVVSAPRLRGKLDPSRRLYQLGTHEQAEFRKALLKFFSDANLLYFSYVDAVTRKGAQPGEMTVHVKVRISRRVPFTIGEEPLYLNACKVVSDHFVIGSPLAESVETTVVRRPEIEEDGLVAEGETHLTVRLDRVAGLKVPIVIGFDRSVETVDIDVQR